LGAEQYVQGGPGQAALGGALVIVGMGSAPFRSVGFQQLEIERQPAQFGCAIEQVPIQVLDQLSVTQPTESAQCVPGGGAEGGDDGLQIRAAAFRIQAFTPVAKATTLSAAPVIIMGSLWIPDW